MTADTEYDLIRDPKNDTWAIYDAKGKCVDHGWHMRGEAIYRAKRIGGKARLIKAYKAVKISR